MAVAWPSVKARLVEALPAVVGGGVTVIDGPVVSGNNPSAYLTIGHQPSVDDETAGSFEQARTPTGGFVAEETGTVLMELAAITGNPDVPDSFAAANAVHDWVQADQTLGVLTPGSTSYLTVEVLEAQNRAGAVQRLLLTLTYTTRV